MKTVTIVAAVVVPVLWSGCASRPIPPAPPGPDDIAATLIVENTTPKQVAVFFISRAAHIRLGTAEPQSESRMPVRRAVIGSSMAFRVYAFRGQEPCPVARIIDLTASRTPRLTVTVADTVLSGYLPADACIRKR